ncbi:MAG TPA: M91 family zinc metallopeptidase [Chitinophagales bacterium]|nr:M91 family zinc metallopeptidase [Chitinophagales bacterium]
MGKPAARVGDMHICPMSDGPKPHVGGPVVGPGIPTVLIGGVPAAVMGDMCTCVSPAFDSIVLGSTGVLIGGKPAARMGDMTAHGGAITVGLPTVLIGETATSVNLESLSAHPHVSGVLDFIRELFKDIKVVIDIFVLGKYEFNDSITIHGDWEFIQKAKRDLEILKNTPSGSKLLESISKSGNKVTVAEAISTSGDETSDGSWSNANLYNGKGQDAAVKYYPNQQPMYGNNSAWDNPPPSVPLGHELCHASHIANGNLVGDPTSGPPIPNDLTGLPLNRALEERRTVGLGPNSTYSIPDFTQEPFSENAIRSDLGEPLRTTYMDPTLNAW